MWIYLQDLWIGLFKSVFWPIKFLELLTWNESNLTSIITLMLGILMMYCNNATSLLILLIFCFTLVIRYYKLRHNKYAPFLNLVADMSYLKFVLGIVIHCVIVTVFYYCNMTNYSPIILVIAINIIAAVVQWKPYNDFHKGICNLTTQHEMDDVRDYQLSLYKNKKNLGQNFFFRHHCIVIRDRNEDITFGLTVDPCTLQEAVDGEKKALAEVKIFHGDKNDLEVKGSVKCTLNELALKAGGILDNNQHYYLLKNNCQNFCNYFLIANGLPTYKTDVEKIGILAVLASPFLSYFGFQGSSSLS